MVLTVGVAVAVFIGSTVFLQLLSVMPASSMHNTYKVNFFIMNVVTLVLNLISLGMHTTTLRAILKKCWVGWIKYLRLGPCA
jgi:hypothetical protein